MNVCADGGDRRESEERSLLTKTRQKKNRRRRTLADFKVRREEMAVRKM